MTHRVFIVEDHPVMREGYVSLINAEPDLDVVGEASSAEDAFDQAADLEFDVAIVDLSLPGVNGVELIKRLRSIDDDVKVLVVSAHDEALYAERALRAGARGYLMKHESAKGFVEAVRQVISGELFLSDSLRTRFLNDRFGFGNDPAPTVSRLTDRELEVFEHFGRGKSTREVAEVMGLSLKTIESHRTNIKQKLGIDRAAEFMQRAVLWVEAPLS
ncbi:response regulator transcription factor [Rubrivirga sp. S365]|uniref:Response regulator transcription factor n=1 Tax=Rubrivirga litoralis TaxID=3075598 RepID=A0ABU3BUK4_9BACT|nr:MULTISPECIES: response regulator transcription factor [unclassified Rubrivirga]MDT0632965.1 response regulator transcription factor [Rubrivirga sp. F394]MDT7856234.1 response regulator transcription factor [Rubrivirga sp. S365]